MTCCAQIWLFLKKLLGLIKNRQEFMKFDPKTWWHIPCGPCSNHEIPSESITKSSYVGKSTKLLASPSILVNLHGNSGSSHAYIQVCACKNVNDASCTNGIWCSMYDKWSIFLMLLHEPQVSRSHVQASTSHLTHTGQNIDYLLSFIVCWASETKVITSDPIKNLL